MSILSAQTNSNVSDSLETQKKKENTKNYWKSCTSLKTAKKQQNFDFIEWLFIGGVNSVVFAYVK